MKTNSVSVVKIILFSAIGFVLFPTLIKFNLVQYSTLPAKINVAIRDEVSNKDVIFSLPVKSKLKIDSMQKTKSIDSGIVLRDVFYHENPAFFIWTVLVTIMLTIASGSFPVFFSLGTQLRRRFNLTKRQVWVSFFTFIGVALLLMISNIYLPGYTSPLKVVNDFHILLKHGGILKLIETSTIVLVSPIIIVMFLIAASSDNISINNELKSGTNNNEAELLKKNVSVAIYNFDFLNQTLRSALQALAIVVVFSVLTSGTLGISVNSVLQVKGMEIYPREICYVYGMFFSLFLTVVYVPVFQYLKYRHTQLKESVYKLEDLEIIKDGDWLKNIKDALKLEGSPLDDFKTALTVLAPLISSFLPDYLHFFK